MVFFDGDTGSIRLHACSFHNKKSIRKEERYEPITMKAIVLTQYGSPDVLRLNEVEKPVPKKNEVLIRIHATPVSFGDLLARKFNEITPGSFSMPLLFWFFAKVFFGFNRPKIRILGSEFAGVVESVGSEVTLFKREDPVFGYLGQNMGAYSEYLCMGEEKTLAIKPSSMSFEEAAAVPYGAITALNLLRKVHIKPGDKVLINGASGGIGSAAVQLAKNYGAEVTGVCGTPRLEYVKSLGADTVIDYTKEDFTRNGETYDLIFDILGKSSFSKCKHSLRENGIYLLASFKSKQLFQMVLTSITGGRKVVCALAPDRKEDLIFIAQLVREGRFRSIVDRCFPMEQAAGAHRYAETGSKKGNIVITMR